jgi:hypothetical protein
VQIEQKLSSYLAWKMKKGLIFGLMTALVLILAACSAAGTPAPTPDPVTVVQSFNQAYNAGQLDEAMAFVADDAVFLDQGLKYSGKKAGFGKAKRSSPAHQ